MEIMREFVKLEIHLKVSVLFCFKSSKTVFCSWCNALSSQDINILFEKLMMFSFPLKFTTKIIIQYVKLSLSVLDYCKSVPCFALNHQRLFLFLVQCIVFTRDKHLFQTLIMFLVHWKSLLKLWYRMPHWKFCVMYHQRLTRNKHFIWKML